MFISGQYGEIGQQMMMKILETYSLIDEKVGYCQSMNFLCGFLLLMSGAKESEVFWVFKAMLAKNVNELNGDPAFDGIRGFYK